MKTLPVVSIVALLCAAVTLVLAIDRQWTPDHDPDALLLWDDDYTRPRGDEVDVSWPPSPDERLARGPKVKLLIVAPEVLSGDKVYRLSELYDLEHDPREPDWLTVNLWNSVQVYLVNDSDQPIVVVRPGDGSSDGWRTPFVHWFIETPDGSPIPPEPNYLGGRCGNVNSLRAEDIVTLAPNERAPLGNWIDSWTVPGPGTYQFTFAYTNIPKASWGGLGYHEESLIDQVRASTEVVAYSEPVTVTIEP